MGNLLLGKRRGLCPLTNNCGLCYFVHEQNEPNWESCKFNTHHYKEGNLLNLLDTINVIPNGEIDGAIITLRAWFEQFYLCNGADDEQFLSE